MCVCDCITAAGGLANTGSFTGTIGVQLPICFARPSERSVCGIANQDALLIYTSLFCCCVVLSIGGHKAFGWVPLPALKGSHLYSHRWYMWLLMSNLVLRFSWAHRLLGDLEAHNSVLLVVALLEVVRRWQWLFVRVENRAAQAQGAAAAAEGQQWCGRVTLVI